MNPVIEFSHAHPVAAAIAGGVIVLALILGALASMIGPKPDFDDWRYW